jgi:hypothetical protein
MTQDTQTLIEQSILCSRESSVKVERFAPAVERMAQDSGAVEISLTRSSAAPASRSTESEESAAAAHQLEEHAGRLRNSVSTLCSLIA